MKNSWCSPPPQLEGRPVRLKAAAGVIRVNGKGYRGWVEVRKKSNGLLVINDLDIEDYLQGVVGAEIPPEWGFEALKAQAVASRTYALVPKKDGGEQALSYSRHRGQPGLFREQGANTRRRSEQFGKREGVVIVYHGEVIPAFYHSSCGGHTENAAELWGIDGPVPLGSGLRLPGDFQVGVWEKRVLGSSFSDQRTGKARIPSA